MWKWKLGRKCNGVQKKRKVYGVSFCKKISKKKLMEEWGCEKKDPKRWRGRAVKRQRRKLSKESSKTLRDKRNTIRRWRHGGET